MSQQITEESSESRAERQMHINRLRESLDDKYAKPQMLDKFAKPQMLDVVAALSQRVKDHFSKEDIQARFRCW